MIRIINADVMDGLGSIPVESVHCVITSPPYWALRDYGVEGQIGLEKTPQEFIEKMVAVFRQIRRVLRSDGTAWMNMGDGYANDGKWGGTTGGKHAKALHGEPIGRSKTYTGLKPKDLIGMPWRLALALQEDGWWLRSDIIWHKPNPMPESCTDRPGKSHEYIFLLTKSPKYFYDGEAIREPHSDPTRGHGEHESNNPHAGRLDDSTGKKQAAFTVSKRIYNPAGRNKRTVWTMPTHAYPGAHYATFPPALPEICIKAGTSEKGCCPECGNAWERITEKKTRLESGSGKAGNPPAGKNEGFEQAKSGDYDIRMGPVNEIITTGWQSKCEHGADPIPCTVLDPFNGHGTTGLVAARLGRSYIGIEINPGDCEASRDRIKGDNPLFNHVEVAEL